MRISSSLFALLFAASPLVLPAIAQQDVIATALGGGPDDIPAAQSNLNNPDGVKLDSLGNYYIAACGQNRVFKVNKQGTLTVVAGLGVAGYSGDGISGGAANAMLNCPADIAIDSSGNVYISDYYNYVIRKVDATATITTIAGIAGACGYNGDGTPATNYYLCHPGGITVDASGSLFVADQSNCRLRRLVIASDTISTVAGNGGCGFAGDGGPAVSAELNAPSGVAVDSSDNIYIADTNNFRIREVKHSTGEISTIAGSGNNGFSGDGGPATDAAISQVFQGVAVNTAGTAITFADHNNQRIRQFVVGGNINTIAGTGNAGFCGDGGAPLNACFYYPQGVAVNTSGSIYVADSSNNRIRLFTPTLINTVAGNGWADPRS